MITLGEALRPLDLAWRPNMSTSAQSSLVTRYRIAFMDAEPWQIRHELTMLAENIRRGNPCYRKALLQFVASKF